MKTLHQPHPTFAPQENFLHANQGPPRNNSWIIDSGVSHHITYDLHNLSLHSGYGGTDDIITGYGNQFPITHIGSTNLASSNSTFQLNNVLCAPEIKQNLLSVSQFCYQNNTSIEFFS